MFIYPMQASFAPEEKHRLPVLLADFPLEDVIPETEVPARNY